MTDVLELKIGELSFALHRKPIKNLHINVLPPDGRVRVSVPTAMTDTAIRTAVVSKLAWIKKQQRDFAEQPRQSPREFIDGEAHFLWGQKYRLRIISVSKKAEVQGVKNRRLQAAITEEMSLEDKQTLFDAFYKTETQKALCSLIDSWTQRVGRAPSSVTVRRMKTKWGSCNTDSKRIIINSELAKKPFECLEYIVVHEFVHLLERHHNERFVALMDKFMPNWRERRDLLNSLPLAHEDWQY